METRTDQLDIFILIEPPHDKINNAAEHPVKTQIGLGIRPV